MTKSRLRIPGMRLKRHIVFAREQMREAVFSQIIRLRRRRGETRVSCCGVGSEEEHLNVAHRVPTLIHHSAVNHGLLVQPKQHMPGIETAPDGHCRRVRSMLVVSLTNVTLCRHIERILSRFQLFESESPILVCDGLSFFILDPNRNSRVWDWRTSHSIDDDASDAIRGRGLLRRRRLIGNEQYCQNENQPLHCCSSRSCPSMRIVALPPGPRVTTSACFRYFSIAAGLRNSRSRASFTATTWYVPGGRLPIESEPVYVCISSDRRGYS